MKIKPDQNLSVRLSFLKELGHDVETVRDEQ